MIRATTGRAPALAAVRRETSPRAVNAVGDAEIRDGARAVAYLNSLIRGPAAPARSRSPDEARRAGGRRVARMREFLGRIGDPQAATPVVHVGGTSGKGSVATKIAAGLSAAGYRTGLHTTPYLQTPLEKLVLDGRLARPGELADLVAWIRPHVAAAQREHPARPPTYGMVWVALTFEYFRRRAADILVLEVGAGGRFDLTNVIRPLVSVVTGVGLDHRKSLGGSLESIAWHKAGILKPGVPAVVGSAPDAALMVVQAEAARVGAPLQRVAAAPGGGFPAVNQTLTEHTLQVLGGLGYDAIDAAAAAAARAAEPPARMESMPDVADVLLDGAHNADKARALRAAVTTRAQGRPIVLVAGVVSYRDPRDVLAPLLPLVHSWVATEPRVYGKPPAPAPAVARTGQALGRAPVAADPDPRAALRRALRIAPAGALVLVAGSMYLAGNVRARWYPTEAIVRSGTWWPAR